MTIYQPNDRKIYEIKLTFDLFIVVMYNKASNTTHGFFIDKSSGKANILKKEVGNENAMVRLCEYADDYISLRNLWDWSQ